MIEKITPKEYSPSMRAIALKEQGIKKLGVAVFIVDLITKRIWTVKENVDKTSTQREVGVLTIPLETRKLRIGDKRAILESVYQNIIGALDEFRELQSGEELLLIGFEPDEMSSAKGLFALVDGVAAQIVILGLRNKSSDEGKQTKTDEVEAVGWKSLDELIQSSNLRKGVKGLLELVKEHKWIDSTVEEMLTHEDRVSIINDDISSYENREELPDMEVPDHF